MKPRLHEEFKYVIDFVHNKNQKELIMKRHARRSGKTTILVDAAMHLSTTDNIIFTVPHNINIDNTFDMFRSREIHSGTKYSRQLNMIIFPNGNYLMFKKLKAHVLGNTLGRCSFISDECDGDTQAYPYATYINKKIINAGMP